MNLLEFVKSDYINILSTLISLYGAWKSCSYYQRIKKLNEYTSLKNAIITLQETQHLLTDIWKNIGEGQRNRRGINSSQKIKDMGTKIDKNLTEIMNSLPVSCATFIHNSLQKRPFPPREFIGTLISGEYVNDNYSASKYHTCKERIEDIQLYLKHESEKIETTIINK